MSKLWRQLLALGVAAQLTGCSGSMNFMQGSGPAANNIAALGWFVLIVFGAVSIVVWILIAWLARRRRGTLDWHAPVHANGGQRWIYVGGIAIPVAVLAIVFIATLQTMQHFPMAHTADTREPPVRVIGHQWWFEAQYTVPGTHDVIASPTEVHIPVGRPIELALETRDVIHSFWVPKLHGKVDLVPGQVNFVRIQADRPGRYIGECGEFCGVQHAHMRVEVVAHSPEEYARWLEHQRLDVIEPSSEQARAGQQVFMNAACPLCHSVRGTGAQGSAGPDLTHVASRKHIAGGMLLNNRANLQAWVTHAQSLKPGARMPSLTQFDGAELNALVTYLQTLQ
jgi:cytochrome c oxidase subunit II